MPPQTRFDSLEDALAGIAVPEDIRRTLALFDVPYLSFDGRERIGQLVTHARVAREVQEIFENLRDDLFPIHSVIPVAAYHWDDTLSMEANNTSAFNYRKIMGTDRVSNHSYGLAIDINPLQNPYYARDGKVYPARAAYSLDAPGTLTPESRATARFKKHGWNWLGERKEYPDYQHFEKPFSDQA